MIVGGYVELDKISGIGPKTITYLNKLGICDMESLISYYPFRYNILKRSDLSLIQNGDNVVLDGTVYSITTVF